MLTYDAMGNPLTYFNGKKNWNFTWKYGRQLASATDGTNTITNAYDVDGVRESKTVDGVEHKYVTLDGKIIRETYGDFVVDYFYDNEGKPYKLEVFNGKYTYTGYYVLNQQGDVIAILNANGVKVVSYEYNAWGQIKEETAASTNVGTLFLEHNALKYRGYYYDAETGFYYVSSRYYDPVIGRFISADNHELLLEDQGNLLQYNLYTYCWNNPVNMADFDGESPANVIGGIVGGAIGAGLGYLAAEQLGLTGWKKVVVVAGAAIGGAIIGAVVGPKVAKVAKKAVTKLKTTIKKVTSSKTRKPSECFVAGTLIFTEHGQIPIEDINVGDFVYAENLETGEKELKEVLQTFINETEELVHVHVDGEEIIATSEHPFYVPNKGWIGAIDLHAGDILVLQSGKYVIVEMVQHEILEFPILVYNLEVEDFHTYYVGRSSVLVHNMCPRMGQQKGGAPRSNTAQNKQFDDIVKKYKLTKSERRRLHDEITGQGLSRSEIIEEMKSLFPNKKWK